MPRAFVLEMRPTDFYHQKSVISFKQEFHHSLDKVTKPVSHNRSSNMQPTNRTKYANW